MDTIVICYTITVANSVFTALIDYINPTMVIVGSRGLGKLKG